MRFYTGPHRFYCGIEWHATTKHLCVLDLARTVVFHLNLPDQRGRRRPKQQNPSVPTCGEGSGARPAVTTGPREAAALIAHPWTGGATEGFGLRARAFGNARTRAVERGQILGNIGRAVGSGLDHRADLLCGHAAVR